MKQYGLLGGVALLILASGLLYIERGPHPIPQKSSMASENTSTKTFASENLRIKFNYAPSEAAPIIEEGDTVYVGGKEGQWVQEFRKDPQDDLKTAIKKKFLVGISDTECPVVEYGDRTVASSLRPNIALAQITFGFQITDLEDPRIALSKCPEAYRETNGMRYFWMDKSHPGLFFFFNIGQYGISANDSSVTMWQDTFEVIR